VVTFLLTIAAVVVLIIVTTIIIVSIAILAVNAKSVQVHRS